MSFLFSYGIHRQLRSRCFGAVCHLRALHLGKPISSINDASDVDLLRAQKFVKEFSKDDLPKDALTSSFSRSSGPGGQNVNKVSTKATLRLALSSASSFLHPYIVDNLRATNHYAKSSDSILVQQSTHRTQSLNADAALEKLHSIVLAAASQGLRGVTSDEQRSRVANLERSQKAKVKSMKRGRAQVKSTRGKVSF